MLAGFAAHEFAGPLVGGEEGTTSWRAWVAGPHRVREGDEDAVDVEEQVGRAREEAVGGFDAPSAVDDVGNLQGLRLHCQQTGEKPSPVMVWTPEQTGAFLDFLAEDRLYAMWHLIAFRGLRRGEACAQPWSETNLDDHSLTVSAQLVQDGWEVETSEPKTDSGFRVVALDDDTVNVLKRHREQQDADRTEWGSAWVETGMVFTQEDGSWLHPGKLTDLFERLVAASGLPPIRLHDLRHGAATLMLAAGIDVKIVSDTLGHSDTRITRDIYQNPQELHQAGE